MFCDMHAGWIYDQTGSYDLFFFIIGGVQLVGLAALTGLKCAGKDIQSD